MGYLSAKDFAQASMNWIAEGVNIVGQGAFLAGALLLHKSGCACTAARQPDSTHFSVFRKGRASANACPFCFGASCAAPTQGKSRLTNSKLRRPRACLFTVFPLTIKPVPV